MVKYTHNKTEAEQLTTLPDDVFTQQKGADTFRSIQEATLQYLTTCMHVIGGGPQAGEGGLMPFRPALSVRQAIETYMESRRNVLSPATMRGYSIILKNRIAAIMDKDIYSFKDTDWQLVINEEATVCSPRTLKNAWGLLSAAISYTTGKHVSVRLPQVVEYDLPYLTPEEIPIFLDAIEGTDVEIACLLALTSLRKSEILGLDWKNIDLKARIISVEGAAVLDEDNVLVKKSSNKNKTSRRKVPIIDQLYVALQAVEPKAGRVVNIGPSNLCKKINKICREHGLAETAVHGLRRSFATLAYHLKWSEEMTMRVGGWNDILTMRKIYTKISERDVVAQSQVFLTYFSTISLQKT